MIRLALRGSDALSRELGARLHGATVEAWPDDDTLRPPSVECDAVAFLESTASDMERICACLASGLHVLLTPLAWVSPEALSRLSAARSAGTQLAIVNPDRFVASRQLIRQQLESGHLGDPGLVRVHRWQSSLTPTPLTWDIDVATWLMGTTPNLVYAVELPDDDRDPFADGMLQLHLGFPGGGMALIDRADRLRSSDGYQALSLIGSTGAAYADDHQNMQLMFERAGHPRAVLVDDSKLYMVALVQTFVSDVQAARDLSASLSTWRGVQTIEDAARRSIASRQAIRMAD
jgi:predicted dehydrogenase